MRVGRLGKLTLNSEIFSEDRMLGVDRAPYPDGK